VATPLSYAAPRQGASLSHHTGGQAANAKSPDAAARGAQTFVWSAGPFSVSALYLGAIEPCARVIILSLSARRSLVSRRARREAKMLDVPHYFRKDAVNRCAHCGGKFGLVRYYTWRTALCSKRCRNHFRVRDAGTLRWLRRLEQA